MACYVESGAFNLGGKRRMGSHSLLRANRSSSGRQIGAREHLKHFFDDSQTEACLWLTEVSWLYQFRQLLIPVFCRQGDDNGSILAVIPDPCFLKLLVKIFFEKEGVCRDLYDVAFPRLGFLPLAKERLASLVFVDHPVTVSMTYGIEFSGESEFFAAEEEGALFLSFFPGQFFVERSSGIDAGVSYANLSTSSR
jgi:hypothetical protein